MSYSVEIIDLLRGHTDALSGGGIDGRILSVTTDSERLCKIAVKVDGVATWEATQELDHSWLLYLAPVHGLTIFLLRDRVEKQLAEAEQNRA